VTEFTDTSLSLDTLYYYRIYALNDLGETFVEKTLSTPNIPDVPQDFNVIADIYHLATDVSWIDGALETGYEIQFSASPSGPFQASVSAAQDATQVTVNLPDPDTTYYFKMRAFNHVGNSNFTGIMEIHSAQSARAVTSMELVAGLNAISVTLNWEASSNATHYRIERSISAEAGFSIIKDLIPNTQTSYIDSDGLNPGEPYDYRLFSVNSLGENPWQDRVVMPSQAMVSNAPFNYDGWSVVDGQIDIGSSGTSICTLSDYNCLVILEADGFLQFQVTQFPVPGTIYALTYIMTIFTNEGANGNADALDYYHVNTSIHQYSRIFYLSQTQRLPRLLILNEKVYQRHYH